jgi:hypothetical protein
MGKSRELASLTPNAKEFKVDGQTIVVAFNGDENRILGFIVAAQIRSIIQKSLKRYSESEAPLSAKELKDIAEAGRTLAEFSAKLYEGSDPIQTEKKAEPAATPTTDFSKLEIKVEAVPSEADSPTGSGGKVD